MEQPDPARLRHPELAPHVVGLTVSSRPPPAARADSRVRQLIDTAAQLSANGRSREAEAVMKQAELEAPRHPLVLNEKASRLMLAGDFAGAHALLEQATSADSSDISVWLNLAAVLRGLKRPAEEMAAIERALSIDRRSMRAMLQKASLQEEQGNSRAAAATYRTALQMIPPGFEPPAAMKPVLDHANSVIAASDRALEAFLETRLQDLRMRYAGEPLERFDRCLDTLLRKQPIYRPQPTFMYFPRLPAIEFYERSLFPWLDVIEAATDDIREELSRVLVDGPSVLEPYIDLPDGSRPDRWREINRSRRWGVFYLWREGVPIEENLLRCPRTVAALDAWPRCEVPGCGPSAVFSILDARTRIPPHSGVSNTRLLVHLPLIVPPGCGFRVGAERRVWEPGKALIFDDTFEHEAWNDSDEPRAVMIFDIWSPYVTAAEREMVSTVTAGVGEYYGTSLFRGS